MRAPLVIVAFGCAILVGAPAASADEQPSSSPKAGSHTPPEADDPPSSTDGAAPAKAAAKERAAPLGGAGASTRVAGRLPRSGVPLLLPGLPPAPAQAAADRQVDLFPPNLFGDRATFQPFSHDDKEHRARLGLGDDGDWRVQAAQIGVMAAGFAALVGLCSGGRCMLPEKTSSFLPGFLQPSQQIMPEIRQEPEIRQAR